MGDLKAKGQVQPRPLTDLVDSTAYQVLRPGVMIHSKADREHGHPATYSTTSGVLMKNLARDMFMTGASHGMSADVTVYQDLGSD